ncbi:MAG: hypothetical protein ACKVVP_01265 [Chloroflexota bacterium]
MGRLRLLVISGGLLIAALWIGVPLTPAKADCSSGWPGGGMDDGQYASLFGLNAPLYGQPQIDRAAARALLEAYNAAGRPADFNIEPYLKNGPDCEGGLNPSGATTTIETDNPGNDNDDDDDNDNDRNENRRNDND